MLWILRTGRPWADLPARYGPVGIMPIRFDRWRHAGMFDRMLRHLQAQADARGDLDWGLHFVDATVVRAHQHAAGARWSGAIGAENTVAGVGEALGRSQEHRLTKSRHHWTTEEVEHHLSLQIVLFLCCPRETT